jgi:hypothetical protein
MKYIKNYLCFILFMLISYTSCGWVGNVSSNTHKKTFQMMLCFHLINNFNDLSIINIDRIELFNTNKKFIKSISNNNIVLDSRTITKDINFNINEKNRITFMVNAIGSFPKYIKVIYTYRNTENLENLDFISSKNAPFQISQNWARKLQIGNLFPKDLHMLINKFAKSSTIHGEILIPIKLEPFNTNDHRLIQCALSKFIINESGKLHIENIHGC